MNEDTLHLGANIDTRDIEARDKDYKMHELVASFDPVNWIEKSQDQWRRFPIFNQDGSGSCVAQTVAKMMGIMYWIINKVYVHFSATHVYQRRDNKPNPGMGGVNALVIAGEGVTLEELVPSQNMSDAEMDGVVIPDYKKKVGEVFKAGKFVQPVIKDIDAIASIIQKTGKPVMVWFYFTLPEWTEKPYIIDSNLDLNAQATARHSVTAVDFALVNGEKCLIIDDSWGSSYGKNGQRVITEKFFKARNWFAAYFINFKFEEGTTDKPTYFFSKVLSYNPKTPVSYGDKDTIALQDALKYLGLFPVNVESTGYFGPATKSAVIKFQAKYGIPQTGTVAEITNAKLNSLFN
jgi:hypothetical protein